MTPLILLDVDGVLNLLFTQRWDEKYVMITAHPPQGTFQLVLNPLHGEWLKELAASTGAELAWGSTWEDQANIWVGPYLGLPELPAAPVRDYAKRSVIPWTQGRRFVWFDDDPGVIETANSAGLGIYVDIETGLLESHVEIAREWLMAKKNPGDVTLQGE